MPGSEDAVMAGSRPIGGGAPCLVAAEAGINHNGSVETAHALIDAAAEAGAGAIKFQNFRTEDFLGDRSLTYEYEVAGERRVESQFDMFKRHELAPEAWPALAAHCAEREILFFSTPTGEESLAELVAVGAPLLKNGSDFLGNLPLIRAMARTGIPTVLSTGMATPADIEEAVAAFRGAGGTGLVLLHCTSSYPAPPESVHLRKIPALAEAMGCPVGLSDHTDGIAAAVGAVALGACMVEKHFTLDRGQDGPDHRFSSDPAEFETLVRAVSDAERALGTSVLGFTEEEEASRAAYRLSCVAARDLPAGHVLATGDLAFHRPGDGIPPARAEELVGRTLAREVPVHRRFGWDDLA